MKKGNLEAVIILFNILPHNTCISNNSIICYNQTDRLIITTQKVTFPLKNTVFKHQNGHTLICPFLLVQEVCAKKCQAPQAGQQFHGVGDPGDRNSIDQVIGCVQCWDLKCLVILHYLKLLEVTSFL